MAVVGSVGFKGPCGLYASIRKGNTVLTFDDTATASGYLTRVRVYKGGSSGILKVAVWEYQAGPDKYVKKDEVEVSLPINSGFYEVDLPRPLELNTGDFIGYYSSALELGGCGLAVHRHFEISGEVSEFPGSSVLINHSIVLHGDLHDVIPTGGLPFYWGGYP